ncbi:MAG: hypothetical protein HN742_14085 [Lentisphaerae bacterium]|nr:hypothetical protein [Lentisphaerota bacterium]MBT4820748.1 hypothetical protein [Lentisphaerota bacterium]MBT5606598.1 hypothetical protein [Lentisphaerota bacterium]MBT7059559.1 hypothetical protein [Lentisphaerota bacterium]MBT7843004.1 hypothetical protein [Lentisphaerota bacterium]
MKRSRHRPTLKKVARHGNDSKPVRMSDSPDVQNHLRRELLLHGKRTTVG